MSLVKTTPADTYDYSRLYGREKYSLQNMEIKAVNFPDEVDSAHAHDVYDDRLPYEDWKAAVNLLSSTASGDDFFHGATDESFLLFAQRIADACGFDHQVTGARVVRFTNSGGFPVYRIDLAHGGKFAARTVHRKQWVGWAGY